MRIFNIFFVILVLTLLLGYAAPRVAAQDSGLLTFDVDLGTYYTGSLSDTVTATFSDALPLIYSGITTGLDIGLDVNILPFLAITGEVGAFASLPRYYYDDGDQRLTGSISVPFHVGVAFKLAFVELRPFVGYVAQYGTLDSIFGINTVDATEAEFAHNLEVGAKIEIGPIGISASYLGPVNEFEFDNPLAELEDFTPDSVDSTDVSRYIPDGKLRIGITVEVFDESFL